MTVVVYYPTLLVLLVKHIGSVGPIVGIVFLFCFSAYLSSCHRTASDANLLDDPHTFHYHDYFVSGGICTYLGVSDDPKFLWISSNSCPLNLPLVQSHQAEIIIVKRLIQGRNNVTRVRVEPDHSTRVVVKMTIFVKT